MKQLPDLKALLLASGAVGVAVTQRNWSRVTVATWPHGQEFVKQFVTVRGSVDIAGYHAEKSSQARASNALKGVGGCTVIPLLSSDEDSLILRYELVSFTTFDLALRIGSLSESDLQRLVPSLDAVLLALASAAQDPTTAELKRKTSSTSPDAICFKGLELRNVGIGSDGHLYLFDLGPAYVGSLDDSLARLLVSLLLLNWGRPVRRWMLGPPVGLLKVYLETTSIAVNWDSVSRELSTQFDGRKANFGTDRSFPARWLFGVISRSYSVRCRRLVRQRVVRVS